MAFNLVGKKLETGLGQLASGLRVDDGGPLVFGDDPFITPLAAYIGLVGEAVLVEQIAIHLAENVRSLNLVEPGSAVLILFPYINKHRCMLFPLFSIELTLFKAYLNLS